VLLSQLLLSCLYQAAGLVLQLIDSTLPCGVDCDRKAFCEMFKDLGSCCRVNHLVRPQAGICAFRKHFQLFDK
jgi:hypothetical protein